MAIILKANNVNLFVSSVLFDFWYHSPNFLDTPRRLQLKTTIYFSAMQTYLPSPIQQQQVFVESEVYAANNVPTRYVSPNNSFVNCTAPCICKLEHNDKVIRKTYCTWIYVKYEKVRVVMNQTHSSFQ
jgi:hypothetical protein